MRTSLIIAWLLVIVAFVLSFIFYGQMTARIDTHWDAQGQVNGTMGRFWGLFLLPLMMAGITLLLIFIPRIDPLNPNFTGFQKHYYAFIAVFNVFMLLVHGYMVFWNANIIQFNPNGIMSIGTGLIFYAVGVMMKNSKRNWFAGIRTPWTLSSDHVWNETHRLGSILFKICAILVVLSFLVPKFSIWIILISSLGVSLASVVYSYVLYRQEQTGAPTRNANSN